MKTYRGLVGGEWPASRPWQLTIAERDAGIHCEEGWMGPRTDLDYAERRKTLPEPGLEIWPHGSPDSRYNDCTIPAPHDLHAVEIWNLRFAQGWILSLRYSKMFFRKVPTLQNKLLSPSYSILNMTAGDSTEMLIDIYPSHHITWRRIPKVHNHNEQPRQWWVTFVFHASVVWNRDVAAGGSGLRGHI
jgi:hypothetical protein